MGKFLIMLALWVLLVPFIAVVAQKAAIEPTKPSTNEVKPVMRTVPIKPEALAVYAEAQKRTEDARKLVEASPAWKDYVIAQNQEQTALLYVLAESGAKPSECKSMTKEGKPLTQGAALDHFDCEAPKADKDKKEAK